MKMLVALVGTKYRGGVIAALVASLPKDEPLVLVREPDNKHDPNAVQVWARGHHIGYVKGSQNRDLATVMDRNALAMPGGAARGAYAMPAKLAIDGSGWPMIELEE